MNITLSIECLFMDIVGPIQARPCRQVIIPRVSAVLNLKSGMIICLHGLVCAENCFVRLCKLYLKNHVHFPAMKTNNSKMYIKLIQ